MSVAVVLIGLSLEGASLVAQESACNAGQVGWIPDSVRSPGGGHGSPLQYSSLENPIDRGAWWSYSPWGRKEWDMTERS